MQLSDIITQNLLKYLALKKFKDYSDLSKFLGINTNTFKCWASGIRIPTLKTLDNISDKMQIPTYYLLMKDTTFNYDMNDVSKYLPNNSRMIFSTNLKELFIKKNKITSNDKASLFFGVVSTDTLMSYTRDLNFRTPPISKIQTLAEFAGVEPYKFLKKGAFK